MFSAGNCGLIVQDLICVASLSYSVCWSFVGLNPSQGALQPRSLAAERLMDKCPPPISGGRISLWEAVVTYSLNFSWVCSSPPPTITRSLTLASSQAWASSGVTVRIHPAILRSSIDESIISLGEEGKLQPQKLTEAWVTDMGPAFV